MHDRKPHPPPASIRGARVVRAFAGQREPPRGTVEQTAGRLAALCCLLELWIPAQQAAGRECVCIARQRGQVVSHSDVPLWSDYSSTSARLRGLWLHTILAASRSQGPCPHLCASRLLAADDATFRKPLPQRWGQLAQVGTCRWGRKGVGKSGSRLQDSLAGWSRVATGCAVRILLVLLRLSLLNLSALSMGLHGLLHPLQHLLWVFASIAWLEQALRGGIVAGFVRLWLAPVHTRRQCGTQAQKVIAAVALRPGHYTEVGQTHLPCSTVRCMACSCCSSTACRTDSSKDASVSIAPTPAKPGRGGRARARRLRAGSVAGRL
eukprot:scaffold443_cov527-Prasinococcus_capsulatus_cf.AAC.33